MGVNISVGFCCIKIAKKHGDTHPVKYSSKYCLSSIVTWIKFGIYSYVSTFKKNNYVL